MKRPFLFAAVCAVVLSQASNVRSEVAAGVILGEPTGISIRIDKFPILGFAWSLKHDWMYAHGDYYFIDRTIQDQLSWYLGGGLAVGFGKGDPGLAVRIPVGLQFRFDPHFELFGELAPGITVMPEMEGSIMGGIGLRYIFK